MNTVAPTSKYRLPSARKVWLNLHLWLGLTAGLVLATIGLTGSLLVFSGPMLKMELGRSHFAVDGPPVLSPAVDQWIANARQSYSDLNAIDYVAGPGSNLEGETTVRMRAQTASGKNVTVNVDPYSGLPLGRYVWEDTYTFVPLWAARRPDDLPHLARFRARRRRLDRSCHDRVHGHRAVFVVAAQSQMAHWHLHLSGALAAGGG